VSVAAETRTKPASVTLDDERVVPGIADAGTYAAHLARYEFVAPMIAPQETVLETACGSGYGTRILASRARQVVGIDYSPLALDYARRHHGAANLRFVQMDCHQLSFPTASFDVVVSFEVFEHLENSDKYLAECRRVLRPGGRLMLSTPNAAPWNIHMGSQGLDYDFHINMVDLEGLRSALRRHFLNVTVYGQRRRGSPIYGVLRALDVFNLRLRLLPHKKRETMQQAMGVTAAEQISSHDWTFGRTQLRQANSFVAVCIKAGA